MDGAEIGFCGFGEGSTWDCGSTGAGGGWSISIALGLVDGEGLLGPGGRPEAGMDSWCFRLEDFSEVFDLPSGRLVLSFADMEELRWDSWLGGEAILIASDKDEEGFSTVSGAVCSTSADFFSFRLIGFSVWPFGISGGAVSGLLVAEFDFFDLVGLMGFPGLLVDASGGSRFISFDPLM